MRGGCVKRADVNPGSTVQKHLELGGRGGLEPHTLLLKHSPYSCILSSFLNYLRRVVVIKINSCAFVKYLLLLPSRRQDLFFGFILLKVNYCGLQRSVPWWSRTQSSVAALYFQVKLARYSQL